MSSHVGAELAPDEGERPRVLVPSKSLEPLGSNQAVADLQSQSKSGDGRQR